MGAMAVAAVAFIGAEAGAFGQSRPATIAVDTYPPLEAAASEIEKISGIPVTHYEDIGCDYPGDQRDITAGNVTPEQIQLHGAVKVIVPRGATLTAAIAVDSSTSRPSGPEATEAALERVNSAYNTSGTLPGRFRVVDSFGAFFAQPVALRNGSGSAVAVRAVFSEPTTFPEEQRSRFETLLLILAEVAKGTGLTIDIGMVSVNGLAMAQLAIGAD